MRADAPTSPDAPGDSRGRPRVLVVDRYVLQPDRDAGSRSTLSVIGALREMGFAVSFWPRDLLYDPQYVPLLQREGVEVFWGEALRGRFTEWFRRHGGAYSYVLLNRPLLAREFLPAVRRHSRAKVLYYGHDLHHARLQREFALTGQIRLRWEALLMRRIEAALWRDVDVVYYPSSEEVGEVLQTIPAACARTLPLFVFEQKAFAGLQPQERRGILFVAGFAHGPNVDAARWLANEILPRLRSAPDVAHLWLVGSSPAREVLELASPRITVTGHVPDSVLEDFYRRMRVAAVPLRAGAGVKGKVVEALHHGLPLVTTPTGAQGLDRLPEEVTVTMDPARMASRIDELIADDQAWVAASQTASAYAQERFSMAAMISVLSIDMATERGTQ